MACKSPKVAHLYDIVDKMEECEPLVDPNFPRHLQPTSGDFVGVPPKYLKEMIRLILNGEHFFSLACS